MIGTSGVAVSPKVYINAGISGAAHHTCGIKDAGLIISINRDSNCPMFTVSDYKIVADWKPIFISLIEKLKQG
jgi:electron transfer flavoprotein alpha subunit